MRKTIVFILVAFGVSFSAMAQRKNVEVFGMILDKENNEPVIQASVQLLTTKDSTFVSGAASDYDGRFQLSKVERGEYLLKVSYTGYVTEWKNITLGRTEKKVDLGTILIRPDAVLLDEATVTAELAQVQVSEDTIVYNTGAYRLPEGSMLEELVRKLPGAEVDDEGKITINGKEIKKIMMDGKEFFSGNTEVAMKNVPVEMIEKVKAYDKQSDLARVTGIDDGEEEAVLDLTVKKGMKKGWFGNTDLAYGTKDRYSAKLMVNRFVGDAQASLVGSANNVNDTGFPGGGGGFRGGRGRNGLTTSKMAGFNFAMETEKLEFGGDVRYRHQDNNSVTKSSSESFLINNRSFSNSVGKSIGCGTNFDANLRFEWKPDTMTNIIFRPTFTYTESDNSSNNRSATFNSDPYAYTDDPLSNISDDRIWRDDSVRVNSNQSRSITQSESKSISGTLQVNRRLNNEGRNITLRGSYSYGDRENTSISASNVKYFLRDDESYSRNRYNVTPSENWSYSLQTTYSEPIADRTYLQFSYRYTQNYNMSDRATYDFSNMDDYLNNMFPVLPDNYIDSIDTDQSRFAEYYNYDHEAQVMLRINREKYQFNIGVSVLPQKSKMTYKYLGVDTTVIRHVVNYTPTARFRYRFSKTHQLDFNYRGRTAQPSMTDLLPITDNSNPLNITNGNPGLKPSFTSTLNANYRNFIQEHQRSFFGGLRFNHILNSISQKTQYNAETGGRITTPENINGNWNANGFFGFNTALPNQKYTVNTNTNVGYNNRVAYLYQNQETKKNKTNTLNVGERLTGTYRNDWLEVSLNGSLNYQHTENNLRPENNMDTYNFSYGASTNVTLPWGTRIATDISNNCRRGYSEATMNTDELIWNAQVSHSFLKRNAATITFQIYDILHQQSNISRNISADMRRDTEYNSITSYCMLHFIYKLNIFGGGSPGQGGRGGRGGFNGEGPRGGRGPGGMGGGRPF